jgi:RIO-like serine/threonine protein kinase
MKFDVNCMRYLSKDDYRVLVAVEMGMRNHELVPIELIANIAKLRHGGSHKILSTLLRYKLVAHAANQYNGYRLSYLGFDILALRALLGRGTIVSVGRQIGVGKESVRISSTFISLPTTATNLDRSFHIAVVSCYHQNSHCDMTIQCLLLDIEGYF